MCIRAISMLDDVFVLEKAVYTDVFKSTPNDKWDGAPAAGDIRRVRTYVEGRKAEEGAVVRDSWQRSIEQENVQYFSFQFAPIGAYSINWPYVAFSGLYNTIMIMDTFHRNQIQMVQVADPSERISILNTTFT